MKQKMHLLTLSTLCCALFLFSNLLNAQQNQKQLEKEIKDKAIREARKESKSLKKSGWYVAPGSLPLDKLIENAWMKQYMVDEQGNARFITGRRKCSGRIKVCCRHAIDRVGKTATGRAYTNKYFIAGRCKHRQWHN
jgi:hypothetical protein